MNNIRLLLIFSLLLFGSILFFSIYYGNLELIFLVLITILMNLIFFILFSRKELSLTNIFIIYNNSLLYVIIYNIHNNIISVMLSLFLVNLLFYLIFKNRDNFLIHPALLVLILISISSPKSFFDNIITIKSFSLSKLGEYFDILVNSGSISNYMFIALIVLGIFYMIINKHNFYSFLSFFISYILFGLLYYIFTDTIVFSSFAILAYMFLITERTFTTKEKTSSILSGVITVLMIALLNYIAGFDKAVVFSLIFISFLNPYLDKMLYTINNKYYVNV